MTAAKWAIRHRVASILIASMAALLVMALPASHGAAFGFSPLVRRDTPSGPTPSDTVTVWGPMVTRIGRGGRVLAVEKVKLPGLASGRAYAVVVERSGSDRLPQQVAVRFGGGTIVRGGESALVAATDAVDGQQGAAAARATRVVVPISPAIALARRSHPAASDDSLVLEIEISGRPGDAIATSILAVPDPTFAVFGPATFTQSTSASVIETRHFAVSATAAVPTTLQLNNGKPDGSARAASAVVTLNGSEIVSSSELSQNAGSFTWLSPLGSASADPQGFNSTVSPTVEICAWSGTACSGAPIARFSIQPSVGDLPLTVNASVGAYEASWNLLQATFVTRKTYRIRVLKGTVELGRVSVDVVRGRWALTRSDGTLAPLVAADVLPIRFAISAAPTLTKNVVLRQGDNVLTVELRSNPGSEITLRLTATDVTPPILAIASPAERAITRLTTTDLSGTVEDETSVTVNVGGQSATLANPRSGELPGYTLQDFKRVGVPLGSEGLNSIAVTATDAGSLTASATRVLIRDTEAPIVALTTPAAPTSGQLSTYTNQPSLAINGTVRDRTRVTANVNSQSLFVADVPGGFTGEALSTAALSGTVTLVEGPNVLTLTAIDQAGNGTSVVRSVTLDTKAPVIALSDPAEGATTTNASVTVRGSASDATAVTVAVNGIPVTLSNTPTANSFSIDVPLAVGANTITVSATDAATNAAATVRHVTRNDIIANLPPDPVTVAPPINPSTATTVGASTSFLFTGTNPIQTGVASGTISPPRAAVVRGRLVTTDGTPFAGAKVTVLNHPEFGQTLSRNDGAYDLAVNGGSVLTVLYSAVGFGRVQRQVTVPWADYVVIPDVVITQLDARVTAVSDPSIATAIQVVQGTQVSDADGTRSATVMFRPGTQSTMTLPNGTIQPLATLNVRATEYTVGPNGPKAMPAPLPPNSGYTYAVELSVDEAEAAGATSVNFSQPIPVYVQNFLAFPVGTIVPAGYYDRQQARWVPAPDGRVIKVLSISGGSADLDTDGDGVADAPATLSALGVTVAEQQTIASKYPAGTTLWRVPVDHFSAWDFNWPYSFPPGSTGPNGDTARVNQRTPTGDCACIRGSIIEAQNQALGERVSVTGLPFALNYRSNRVVGWTAGNTIGIPLIGSTVPSGLKRIDLDVLIAGQHFSQSFPAFANQTFPFAWDGKDAYGRQMFGGQQATIRISFVYQPVYYAAASSFRESFGSFGTGVAISGKGRSDASASVEYKVTVNAPWDSRQQALGGWTFDVHHAYDPGSKLLLLGTGETRNATLLGPVISTVVGNGTFGRNGDGGSATQAQLAYPEGIAFGPDGSLYIATADQFDSRIRRVDPNGIITTVAGTGISGFFGDGGPATQAEFSHPQGIAVGPDGSIYVADLFNHRVRKIDPAGIVTTVAGNFVYRGGSGAGAFSGDGGPATQAALNNPTMVAVGPDGAVYFADFGNYRIRKVDANGIITTVAGGGNGGDGVLATNADLGQVESLAFGPDGALYVTVAFGPGTTMPNRVRRIGPDGIITTVAGNGGPTSGAPSGDGGPAKQAILSAPLGLAFGPDGAMYFSTLGTNRHSIRRVGVNGIITTVAGPGAEGFNGDGVPASLALLDNPDRIAFGPDGSLYFADSYNQRIRRIAPSLPGFAQTDVLIGSEDGSEVYVFDGVGRHKRTVDALTSAVLFNFTYDAAGRLTSVVDRDGRATTIQRDASGNPTAIIAPSAEATTLTTANGYLATVTDPKGQVTRMGYTASGLLTSFADPLGNVSQPSYDATGNLVRDQDATGASQQLNDIANATGHTVTLQTGQGRTSSYRVETASGIVTAQSTSGTATRLINTAADGTSDVAVVSPDGSRLETAADGTTTTTIATGDPRFQMMAPVVTNTSIRLPSGLALTALSGRRVTLANASDPLSIQTLRDSSIVNGRLSLSVYNASQRQYTVTSPEGRVSTAQLNALGRVVSTAVAGLDPMTMSYDAKGNLISASQGTRTWQYAYDAAGRVTKATDPLTHNTSFAYDAAGRLTTQTLADGSTVAFAYAAGNMTSVTPPGRPAHTFTYNQVNLPSSYTPPAVAGAGSTSYQYDLDRHLTKVTRPDASTIDLTYNSGGRLSTVKTALRQSTYAYSATTGQLTSISAVGIGGTSTSYTYDGALPISETWSGTINGSVAVQYDNNFHVVSQTVNGSAGVAFAYDRDGLLTGAGALTITRNAQNGLPTGTTLGSVTSSRTYNSFGEPASDQASFSGTALYQGAYTRDALGRISTLAETVQGATSTYGYTYDLAGRLSQVTLNGVPTASYSYDANGNRTSLTTPNGQVTATYDDQDRSLTYGSATYTYTANGELATKTVGSNVTQYSYDEFGNLRNVTLPNGTAISYAIDARNRRVGKYVNGVLVKGFLYAGQLAPVAELDGTGQMVTRFVYGSRQNVPEFMIKGGTTYRLVLDHLGSVRLVVDIATGAVAQRIDYDEFGRITQNTNPAFQPFGFAGGVWDEDVQLARFGARDYDAVAGRWTAKDPSGFAGGSANLYAYAANSPVVYRDVTGHRLSNEESLKLLDDIVTLQNRYAPAARVATGVFLAGVTAVLASEIAVAAAAEITVSAPGIAVICGLNPEACENAVDVAQTAIEEVLDTSAPSLAWPDAVLRFFKDVLPDLSRPFSHPHGQICIVQPW